MKNALKLNLLASKGIYYINFCKFRTLGSNAEESWKISDCVFKIPTKLGKMQIHDFKKQSWRTLNDPEKHWKISDCILKNPTNLGKVSPKFNVGLLDSWLNFLVGILDFLDNLPWSSKIPVGFPIRRSRKSHWVFILLSHATDNHRSPQISTFLEPWNVWNDLLSKLMNIVFNCRKIFFLVFAGCVSRLARCFNSSCSTNVDGGEWNRLYC